MYQVIIEGTKYPITNRMNNVMLYFQQIRVISEQTTSFKLQSSFFTKQIWEKIVYILEKYDYRLPLVQKISSNRVEDYLPLDFIQFIQKMTAPEVNKLYLAVHYLRIRDFRNLIAAYYSCKVFINKTKDNYNLLADQLGVKSQISMKLINTYKQKQANLH